jgi:micrococcal nuclease
MLNLNRGTRVRSALRAAPAAALAALLGVSCSSAGGATGRVLAAPPADGGAARSWSRAPSEKTQIRGGYVSHVIDGDTIEVRVAGRSRPVRLIGIDSPEVVDESRPAECFGREAAEHTSFQLEGGRVRLELDIDKEDDDRRLLAYVWHRGSLFNRALVSRGYAAVSKLPHNFRYSDILAQAQRAARASRRGMWDACFAPPKPAPKPKSEHKAKAKEKRKHSKR